ncbi:hypothetical protein B0H21DRAFT_727525 [Amylocystis lapponica]|nr:hypothetical protein B0H21DRAFT_727525 [Amylocystis lapponica]
MHHAQHDPNPLLSLLNIARRWSQPSPPSPLLSVPADVLFEIARHLSISDTLHLSLTSCQVHSQVLPAIYTSVELRGPVQCEATLRMLHCTPAVARHVQRLVVRPEQHPPTQRVWDVAGMVSRMVGEAARRLDALRVFEWDGEDMLPDDRMWANLRIHCPYLRHVGTTFGCFLPNPGSNRPLWILLCFKDGFYGHQLHVMSRGMVCLPPHGISTQSYTESEPVFTRLWDMLLQHCPNLETLSIAGTFPEAFNAAPLCNARWPRLRAITIGDVVFAPSEAPHDSVPELFLAFLERHPTLQSLHVLGRPNIAPLDLTGLSPDALPCLEEFSGSLDHLRALVERGQGAGANPNPNAQQNPHPSSPLSATLRRLSFPEPMQLRELTPLTISRVLMELHALTSLTVTFALQSGYDSNSVFRTIVAACPQLLHLDLTCACRPSFYLESFSRSLRNLSRLQTLALTVVKFQGEEPMHAGAARIALANPRLTHFSIAYLPAHASARPHPRALERGVFELACDVHGIPVGLLVAEWRATLWGSIGDVVGIGAGWRAGRGGWTRRWVSELRPSGHPDVPQRGWIELLVERSPAGEEARLLVFCLCLLVLAVWGVVGKGPTYGLFSDAQTV